MTDCPDVTMRELLPDYLHDAVDTRRRAAVAEHLAACPECRAELALLARARQALDRAPAIDLDRVAAAVVAARPGAATRPRIVGDGAPPRVSGSHARAWRAAAVVLVAGLGALPFVARRQGGDAVARRADTLAVAGPAATTAALRPTPPELTFGSGISDLDAEALEALILAVEGLDALPHTDPAPLLSVDPLVDAGAD